MHFILPAILKKILKMNILRLFYTNIMSINMYFSLKTSTVSEVNIQYTCNILFLPLIWTK